MKKKEDTNLAEFLDYSKLFNRVNDGIIIIDNKGRFLLINDVVARVSGYKKEELILAITFSIVGFLIIPLISKLVGCKNCEIKEECPWMQKN